MILLRGVLQRWIDYTWSLVTSWPPLDKWECLALLIGAIGAAASIFGVVQAARAAIKAQRIGVVNLADLIWNRMKTPRLMTESAIRGLARNVELSIGCPHLTDCAIAHALRVVAIRAESSYKGAALLRLLTALNQLIRAFDEEGPPLLSIATKDRAWAYSLAGVALSLGVFAIQFWVTRLPLNYGIKAIMITMLSIFQLAL